MPITAPAPDEVKLIGNPAQVAQGKQSYAVMYNYASTFASQHPGSDDLANSFLDQYLTEYRKNVASANQIMRGARTPQAQQHAGQMIAQNSANNYSSFLLGFDAKVKNASNAQQTAAWEEFKKGMPQLAQGQSQSSGMLGGMGGTVGGILAALVGFFLTGGFGNIMTSGLAAVALFFAGNWAGSKVEHSVSTAMAPTPSTPGLTPPPQGNSPQPQPEVSPSPSPPPAEYGRLTPTRIPAPMPSAAQGPPVPPGSPVPQTGATR